MGSIIRKLEFNIMRRFPSQFATVAQQVEQFTRNEQVASSNLASSSKIDKFRQRFVDLPITYYFFTLHFDK